MFKACLAIALSFVFIGVHSWLDAAGSADSEANVADGLAAEAFFEFSQDVDLGDLFEFVVQGRLENADVENAVA